MNAANQHPLAQTSRIQLILVHANSPKITPWTWVAPFPVETLLHYSLNQVIEYGLVPMLQKRKPAFLQHASFDPEDASTLPVLVLVDQPKPAQDLFSLVTGHKAALFKDIQQWHYLTDLGDMLKSAFDERATHFIVFEPGIQFETEQVVQPKEEDSDSDECVIVSGPVLNRDNTVTMITRPKAEMDDEASQPSTMFQQGQSVSPQQPPTQQSRKRKRDRGPPMRQAARKTVGAWPKARPRTPSPLLHDSNGDTEEEDGARRTESSSIGPARNVPDTPEDDSEEWGTSYNPASSSAQALIDPAAVRAEKRAKMIQSHEKSVGQHHLIQRQKKSQAQERLYKNQPHLASRTLTYVINGANKNGKSCTCCSELQEFKTLLPSQRLVDHLDLTLHDLQETQLPTVDDIAARMQIGQIRQLTLRGCHINYRLSKSRYIQIYSKWLKDLCDRAPLIKFLTFMHFSSDSDRDLPTLALELETFYTRHSDTSQKDLLNVLQSSTTSLRNLVICLYQHCTTMDLTEVLKKHGDPLHDIYIELYQAEDDKEFLDDCHMLFECMPNLRFFQLDFSQPVKGATKYKGSRSLFRKLADAPFADKIKEIHIGSIEANDLMAIADLVKPANFPNLAVLASKTFSINNETVNAFKTIICTSEYPNLKLADAIWVPLIHLLPSTRQAIREILPEYTNGHLAPIAAWADRVRFNMPWTGLMHYISPLHDDPPKQCGFDVEDVRSNINLLTAIANYTARLDTYRGDFDLRFLVHYVGDLHQPLHLILRERGGNGDPVLFDHRRMSLHGLWDSQLIAKTLRTQTNYTRALPSRQIESSLRGTIYDSYIRWILWEGVRLWWRKDIPDWLDCSQNSGRANKQQSLSSFRQFEACPDEWAVPIHNITCTHVFPPNYDPHRLPLQEVGGSDYYGRILNDKIMESLLAKGGLRLAAILNNILASPEELQTHGLLASWIDESQQHAETWQWKWLGL